MEDKNLNFEIQSWGVGTFQNNFQIFLEKIFKTVFDHFNIESTNLYIDDINITEEKNIFSFKIRLDLENLLVKKNSQKEITDVVSTFYKNKDSIREILCFQLKNMKKEDYILSGVHKNFELQFLNNEKNELFIYCYRDESNKGIFVSLNVQYLFEMKMKINKISLIDQ